MRFAIIGKTTECSSHFYDVYKLYSLISDKSTIKRLAKETREERMNSSFCESVDPKNNINGILQKIADSDYYKKTRKIRRCFYTITWTTTRQRLFFGKSLTQKNFSDYNEKSKSWFGLVRL